MTRRFHSFISLIAVTGLISCGRQQRDQSSPNEADVLELQVSQCLAKKAQSLKPSAQLAGQRYPGCSELAKDMAIERSYHECLHDAQERIAQWEDSLPSMARTTASTNSETIGQDRSAPSAVEAAGPNILANLRTANVDEDDFVKFSTHHILIANGTKLNVVDRQSKKHMGSIRLDQGSQSLFVNDDKLVVLAPKSITLYHLESGQLPREIQSRSLRGQHKESRLVGNRLVIVSSYWTDSDSQPNTELCNSTFKPVQYGSMGQNQTILESVSLHNLEDSKKMVFLDSHNLYMTEKNIYLYSESQGLNKKEKTLIRKIQLAGDGSLSEPKHGILQGKIKDVWALSELASGELAAATSSGRLWNKTALNHFTILAEQNNELRKISATEDFAANEDIRSVRFVGKMAYVVTFKNTDPLFAIDVSQPSAPKILGELKIPGFSTYMHPLNAERLIGLGFDALDLGERTLIQGLQLSLFDVSNPQKMERKDVKILGDIGSHSLATKDHRAFLMDSQEQVIGFPVQLHQAPSSTPMAAMLPHEVIKSGAILVKVDHDRFGQEHFISHKDLQPSPCRYSTMMNFSSLAMFHYAHPTEIERLFKIDGEYLSVGRSGLKSFRLSDKIEVSRTESWESNCD